MKLTVGDALKLPPLSLGNLVAGKGGINKEIHSITVIEVPDRSEFLQPHLLAISSMCVIADDVKEQLALIRLLNKYEGSGLVVFNVGLVLPSINAQLIELCNELDFPLIDMPRNISYYQVIEVIMDQLLRHQSHRLNTSLALYEAFMEQLLDSRDDYSTMLGMLSRHLERNVLFFNHNRKCVYASGDDPESELIHQLVKEMQINFVRLGEGHPMTEHSVDIEGTPYLLIPVVHKQSFYGILVIANMSAATDLERLALEQTKRTLCVAAFGNVRMDEYYERMRREYLWDLLQGSYDSEALIISQGRELGYDVQNISCAIVGSPLCCRDDGEKSRVLHSMYVQANRVMPEDIVVLFEDIGQVVILCSHNERGDPTHLARDLSNTVKAICGQAPSIGIGSVCTGVKDIPQSYQRAANTMLLSHRIFGEPRCESYARMSLYDLLFKSIDPDEAAWMVRMLLEPVHRYDKTYNANLEETFQELLDSDGSTPQVAKTMYLHRNTVLQRKNKIMDLYKRDPFVSPERLQFELAFLLKRMFDLEP
ncbi:MAG: PucR family transcriptional regulator [Bacillota bacterium]|jgi:purine catabolism regulator